MSAPWAPGWAKAVAWVSIGAGVFTAAVGVYAFFWAAKEGFDGWGQLFLAITAIALPGGAATAALAWSFLRKQVLWMFMALIVPTLAGLLVVWLVGADLFQFYL